MKTTKLLRKLTALIVICILWLCFLSCNSEEKEQKIVHEKLPPGYTMTCDGLGHYVPLMRFGTELTEYKTGKPFTLRQDAIERAWAQYEYASPAEIKYNYPECE